MSTDKQEDRVSNGRQVDRRTFVKTTGIAAGVPGGIEGILAARRAPAFAQGTKLHWVRWVDFIPESDVELKRQMPEASKALGAECVLETINANDLQARITAAIQSGAGADIFNFQYNWAHLYQNAVSDVSDVAGDAPTFTYTMLWAFGGAETDKTGKKVVLNSKGAVDSVKFMQSFWKDSCDEGGLAWDDTNNNRAFHAGEIAAT